jgi:hypothetical protein
VNIAVRAWCLQHFPRDNWDGLNLGIAAAQLVLQKI